MRKLCKVLCHIYIGLGGAKRWGGEGRGERFKSYYFERAEEGDKPQREAVFLGGVDTSIHHEGCSHYVILLF